MRARNAALAAWERVTTKANAFDPLSRRSGRARATLLGAAAIFLWDEGTRRGDLPLLGTLGYAAPVLATLFLAALGHAPASAELWLACALIVGGGLFASREPAAQSG